MWVLCMAMKNLFTSFLLTIALIQPFSPLLQPVWAEDDSDVFQTQLKGIYGSLPNGYDLDIYATIIGGLPRNIVVMCKPDNPKLEAAALKAAAVMPWKGMGSGNERHFFFKMRDAYTNSGGPISSSTRFLDEEELWAKGLRPQISNKWGADSGQIPLTNIVAVGELSASGVLSKLWLDSNPKSPELEKKLQDILASKGLITSLPSDRRSFPQQFWLNVVLQNDSQRKVFGLNGPFLSELKGMDASRAKAASDKRYSLINGYSFWLFGKRGNDYQYSRSSLPVEFKLAGEDQTRKAENVAKRGDMRGAASFITSNPQLLANLKAGKEALVKNDFETAKARMNQCIEGAKTDKECLGSGAELANQISVAYLDGKQPEVGKAFATQALAEMEKKQFYCSAYMCIIPLLKFASDAKSKEEYMAVLVKSKDLIKAAVAKLKPTSREDAEMIVGATMLAPLMLGVGLERLDIKEADPEGVQAKAIIVETMEMTKQASKYCKNIKYTEGSASADSAAKPAGAAAKAGGKPGAKKPAGKKK